MSDDRDSFLAEVTSVLDAYLGEMQGRAAKLEEQIAKLREQVQEAAGFLDKAQAMTEEAQASMRVYHALFDGASEKMILISALHQCKMHLEQGDVRAAEEVARLYGLNLPS